MTQCLPPVPGAPRFSVCLILDSRATGGLRPDTPSPCLPEARRERSCLGIRLGLWSPHDPDLLGDRQASFLLGCQLPYLWSGLKSAQWSCGQIKWGGMWIQPRP